MNKTIIGVAGLKPSDAQTLMESLSVPIDFEIWFGFQISYKSMRAEEISPEYAQRILSTLELSKLKHIKKGPSFKFIVHYNPSGQKYKDTGDHLYNDLAFISRIPTIDGIQINGGADASFVKKLEKFQKRGKRIIYQYNPKRDGSNVSSVWLRRYRDCHVLLDQSGGRAKLFDPQTAKALLKSSRDPCYKELLIISGGLGPDTISHLDPLLKEFGRINTDAEGELLDANGKFSTTLAKQYIDAMIERQSKI